MTSYREQLARLAYSLEISSSRISLPPTPPRNPFRHPPRARSHRSQPLRRRRPADGRKPPGGGAAHPAGPRSGAAQGPGGQVGLGHRAAGSGPAADGGRTGAPERGPDLQRRQGRGAGQPCRAAVVDRLPDRRNQRPGEGAALRRPGAELQLRPGRPAARHGVQRDGLQGQAARHRDDLQKRGARRHQRAHPRRGPGHRHQGLGSRAAHRPRAGDELHRRGPGRGRLVPERVQLRCATLRARRSA